MHNVDFLDKLPAEAHDFTPAEIAEVERICADSLCRYHKLLDEDKTVMLTPEKQEKLDKFKEVCIKTAVNTVIRNRIKYTIQGVKPMEEKPKSDSVTPASTPTPPPQKPKPEQKPKKSLTPSQRKLIDNSNIIWEESSTSKDAAFMARQLVQCTLPHKDPKDVPTWSRKNGNLTLRLTPSYRKDEKTGNDVCIGYPYGTIPRLLLFWLITETIRTKNHIIHLGNSLNGFMESVGLSRETGGGKRSDAVRLKNQMERLFSSVISFEGEMYKDGQIGNARLNMTVASKTMLWWNPKKPDINTFESWVELSKEFYEAITAAPVPVDIRALRALKQSPLALDLYSWLTYEAYRANKSGNSRFETWEQLHNHMGGDYAEVRNFRLKAKAALQKIKVVYPALRLGKREDGIEVLSESLPALQPRYKIEQETITTVSSVKSSGSLDSNEKQLKPVTIEKFRKLYAGYSSYDCKSDFDNWVQMGNITPKNYDAMFLNFAKKWVK